MADSPVEKPDETPGDISVGKLSDPASDEPNDPASDEPNDPASDEPSDPASDKPNDQASDKPCDQVSDKPSDPATDKPSVKTTEKKGKINQFDKFKRRLIRTVARMMITEKVEPSEMWKTMNKETGRDCKTIWEHMRALTLRKLSRLLAADDYVTKIGEVARMSPVDWLQFDLVLVHEDIDVWDLSSAVKKNLSKLSAPWDLLQLAHQHNVVHTIGEQLAHTWATVTVHYNRNGRQCSPMLLQKRWYQLLQRTRDKFYVFWYEYRGVDSRISQAKEAAPSCLEYAIAKCYPKIVTNKFPKWTEAMQDGQHRIVLVNELQQVMRDKQREKLLEEGPELVLMEPKIDTIEVGDDSDEEKADDDKANKADTVASNEDNTKTDVEVPSPPKIKEEPPDEHIENLDPDEAENGLSNVKIVTAAHLTTEEIIDNDVAQLDLIDKDAHKTVLDENSIDDNDIERVVLSPDKIVDKVDASLNLGTNNSKLVTEIPVLTANKLNSVTDDLKLTTIIVDDMTTDLNTTKTMLNTSEGGIIKDVPVIAEKLDITPTIQAKSLIRPEFLTEDEPFTNELNVVSQETTTITLDDMDTDLNTNKMDLHLPEADIIKVESEFAGKTNTTTSILDELFKETIESSDDICNTNNICISETKPLNHENLNDTPCSKDQNMIVKIEHTILGGSEENTISKVNTVSPEIITKKQFDENLTKFVINKVTVATNYIETNSSRKLDPDFIYSRTLTDTVSIANQSSQASDIEEDIIMYEPTLNDNIDKVLESILPANDVKITVIVDDSESMQIVDDGIDDGEYLVNYESVTDSKTQPHDTSGISDDVPTKIDLKLIMNAIVFTTKLDNMKSLKNMSYEEVKSDVLINKVLGESKPVKLQSIPKQNNSATGEKTNIFVTNENQNNNAASENLNIDENLTIDFNNTFDETNVEIKMEYGHNEDEIAGSNTLQCSEMDGFQDDQESSEDEYEDVRINPNSKVFKKPNNISYNPVQLCKNPDFNTRLKRIPILFYTYQSNKEYLKQCKPLTIDLDKGFERKMYNNTIYLKRDPNAVKVEVAPKIQNTISSETDNIHKINKQLDSVELTAAHDQGNEVQVKLETELDISNDELLTERKRKLISLHDIVKVRRINQQLLTAEISPILKYESDNINNCESIDLTSKSDTLPVAEMNVVKEEPTDPKVLMPENPTESNTTPLNQQPTTQTAKLTKPKATSKQPCTPWYRKKTPYGRPIEKLPVPSNEAVENRVRRIYGDSLLTDDAVNKMLLILETDALNDDHVKRFFSCRIIQKPVNPPPKNKKRKLSTELVDQNINRGDYNSENIVDDEERKMQDEEEIRKRDLEKKKKRRDRLRERRKEMRKKKSDENHIEIRKTYENIITPQVKIVRRNNQQTLLTSNEHKAAKKMLTVQKTSEVKYKMLYRTPVQCHSTPIYSLRGGFDNGPKMTMFYGQKLIVKKGPKSGAMRFLIPSKYEKKLTMSPIILRNYGHNEKSTESRIMPKQTEIKPSPVPLSRDKVKLNIKPNDIVLSAKFLSMFPENSSFGKDKIILTTANLDCFAKIDEPSPVKATPAPIVHSDSQQLFPPFAVPEGVRFYLTATGDVVGTVDACITDPNVTNSIPFYVTAIKDMLISAHTSKEATADPVSTTIDITQCETIDNLANTESVSVANTIDITISETDEILKSANTSTLMELTPLESTKTSELMEIDQCLNADELKETESDVPEVTKNTNIMELVPYSEAASQGNDKITEKKTNKPYCTNGDIIEKNNAELVPIDDHDSNLTNDHVETNSGHKKSILSDLMAMTGITSEDINPDVPEIPVSTVIPVTNIVPVAPVEHSLANYFSDLTSEDTNPNLKLLTPVTSFDMLKYANNQNAEFYKLDLITGIILPITVGFKRVKTYAKRNNIRTVQMHSTIDLTDDGDDIGLESNKASIGQYSVERATLLDDDDELPPTLVYKQKPRSRKQKLQPRCYEASHTEGIMKLSEFEEPVEVENLEDSNGSQMDSESENESGDESDDDENEKLSSDEDEPLSTVISRRKSKDKKATYGVAIYRDGQSSINGSETDVQSESTSRKTNVLNFNFTEDMEPYFELDASIRSSKNPGDVIASMNQSDGDESMNVSDDDASMNDSDEDFILGV